MGRKSCERNIWKPPGTELYIMYRAVLRKKYIFHVYPSSFDIFMANDANSVAALYAVLLNNVNRTSAAASLLPSGQMVAGGCTGFGGEPVCPSTEIYNPKTDVWTVAPPLLNGRTYHTATLLPNGTVLIAGSLDSDDNPLASMSGPFGVPTLTFLRGTYSVRRRRQTSRFELAAGSGSFGLFGEPVALLIPPLSFFGFTGEFWNRLLVHCSVLSNRSGSRSSNDAVVDGLKALSSRIGGNRRHRAQSRR